ncbi:Aminopeptidase 2, mitochondrial [Psilocybe cubensis]|uniref:Aminopeptidase 2, mitochondrial n=1 Tax=Psilocybe cubensis TaxID=181762 RepID=A0ACB8H8C9_PSICU|nr:Aminopeptidase 2, mitochondrial [Psilocybe cubensis]KAH9483761.1 Aminopeptidase 2, mitochondrial [Psilocybe cubensis]
MSTTASSGDADQYRLPTDVKPTHYDVTIKTDLENLTFEGLVKISLDVKAETSQIVLNATDLDLGKASLYSDALKTEQVTSVTAIDKTQERVTYQLTDKLPAGSKAELKIAFAGKLTGAMMGYYKSSWENEGKTEYYALTQFEACIHPYPTAARRAFPCWDEPLLKATFSITMISRANTVSLSNMPAISEEPLQDGVNSAPELADIVASTKNEEWKITKFEKTPPMSSYIVAVANGPFKFLETSVVMPLSGKTIPLRIYTTPDLIHQAQYALDVKAAVLPLYEKIFDVEYPLPKLDTLVASDFDAGAMENWGLITGRTNAFLLDPERIDLQAKKRVASVQSHEVAHMWFGNITTMEWWNYLYLNEDGRSDYTRVYPEWRVNSEFITDHLSRALSLDSKLSSHPIEVECPDANHINQIFDALSYSKAASVLRMLSYYVGEEKFLKGVSIYLKKKLFANSVTHDLWDGISTSTGLNITELMENWITKIGFPVVTVTENENGITVRQDRFLETGPAEPKDNETIWNIPLSILSTKDGKAVIDRTPILTEREKSIPLDTTKPFKLNAGTNGVYRVLYTPERLALIAAEAAKENSVFSLEDRMGLVYDAMALARAGFSKLSSSLNLVDGLKSEKEFLVWQGISGSLGGVKDVWWESPEITEKLDAFSRSLFVPLVKNLGYDYPKDESIDASQLRTLAVGHAYAAGDEGVTNELRGRFRLYQETGDDSKIPADLQRVIYSAAVEHGGRAEYDAMVKIYDKPKTPSEKIAAIRAMGVTQNEALLEDTFKFISTKARDQDVIYFFASLATNYKARRALTKYLQDEYDALYKRFEGNFTLGTLISQTINFYSTKEDYAKVEAFFQDKDKSKYNQSLAQALDSIRARTDYREVRMTLRDAVLNSPIQRRATHLSVLLNQDDSTPPPRHSSIHSLLSPQDDALASLEPIRRSSMDINYISPAESRRQSFVESPRPSSSSADSAPPRSTASPISIPYNPRKRITKADSVLIPLSQSEIEKYKNFRGAGAIRLTSKRKRAASDEPEEESRPVKRHTGDVGIVAHHYNSRPDVGVEQRSLSPIIGLKAFNNWVKSVLITRFGHPVFEKSSVSGPLAGPGRMRIARGKVLDLGCGKGGDTTKWAKAHIKEYLGADIAAVSVDQARGRWESLRGPRFDAMFAALDCFSQPISKAFPPAKLAQPFDVVSMQFCMHYAFETVQKARCMLDNVSRYLRKGGVFIGTIPNADFLLDRLDEIPEDTDDLSFGNSVYRITFEDRERPVFGHKYTFFLQDAVENVPEYVVRWDNFVQMAAEYGLHPIYRKPFHEVFQEHMEHPEFQPLLIRMKVVNENGESSMTDDQWEAANIYIGFAFEKR